MNEHLARVAHRFPLVPRPRPAQLPIPERIAEIATLATTPPAHPDYASRIATAYNRAALIASDCGDTDLARALCWEHYDHYAEQPRLDATTARRALEPLVNLARLHIRDQRPDAAIAVLESLLNATRRAGTAQVDHRSVRLDQDRLNSPDARRQVHRWLWTVVVADGIRALARADRWNDALDHAERHHGIGTTLLDGRQAAVIAYARRGEHDAARATLEQSTATPQWQRAVHACLELATREGSDPPQDYWSVASRSIKGCTAEPLHFRAHLVLTAADLTLSPSGSMQALHDLAIQVVESGDASLAGVLLRHWVYQDLPEPVKLALQRTHARIVTATDTWKRLCAALNRPPSTPPNDSELSPKPRQSATCPSYDGHLYGVRS